MYDLEKIKKDFLLIDKRLFEIKDYVDTQFELTKKNYPDQFQAVLVLHQIKRMMSFLDKEIT